MNSASYEAPEAPQHPFMSYARARLYLGMSCVGMWVALAGLALAFSIPQRLFAGSSSLLTDLGQVVLLVLIYTALQAPFDFFGGYLLPKEYGRYTPSLGRFLLYWFRAATVHGLLLGTAGILLLAADRTAGFWLTLAVYGVLQVLLWWGQAGWAGLVAGLRFRPQGDLLFAESPFRHFTGGFAGPGSDARIVLPAHWLEALPAPAFEAQLARRRAILQHGARNLGLLGAVAWNSLGFVLAYMAAGGVSSGAALASFALYNTLWAFLGVLLLPSASRPAIFWADAAALQQGADSKALAQGVALLDQDQDDEPSRSRWVETIFHPVPSVNSRLERLGAKPTGLAAWHLARTALYLSWVNLSFLSRAVHCNLGRPEVWVFLPGD